jgi:hypothetical protein
MITLDGKYNSLYFFTFIMKAKIKLPANIYKQFSICMILGKHCKEYLSAKNKDLVQKLGLK